MARDTTLAAVLGELVPNAVPAELVAVGGVTVDGVPARSPRRRLRRGQVVSVPDFTVLRGSVKLRAALEAFEINVEGRVALDAGASTGGFTTVLLEAGAARVYAVDAGHGQLLGRLRQDPRVVNLESVNLSRLDTVLVPETVEVVTLDLSYLSLTAAVAQLGTIHLHPQAHLVGLVKPMFELRRASAPRDRASVLEALNLAEAGLAAAGWRRCGAIDSPVTGGRGAPEMLLWATRCAL